MAAVVLNSFASSFKVNTGDSLEFATITGKLKGLQFWFETSGVQSAFPKWNPETAECSFLRITTNPGGSDEREYLYPIVAGLSYISLAQFDLTAKMIFTYDQTTLKDLTVVGLDLLPPLPLPGISPLLPPLPPIH